MPTFRVTAIMTGTFSVKAATLEEAQAKAQAALYHGQIGLPRDGDPDGTEWTDARTLDVGGITAAPV